MTILLHPFLSPFNSPKIPTDSHLPTSCPLKLYPLSPVSASYMDMGPLTYQWPHPQEECVSLPQQLPAVNSSSVGAK